MSSKSPKEPKPPKEKKVYYSSRGGAGRSKSVGPPATRKPVASSAPSRMIEVPVPMNKTTGIGRGGGGNARTFVVEDGVFEQVMAHEITKIQAMKDVEGRRKTVSLRGGAVMPTKHEKDDKAHTSTQSSGGEYDDHSSTKSIATRFPRLPSFNASLFSRARPTSPISHAGSGGSELLSPPVADEHESQNGKHCATCQCWGHTNSTQPSLDLPPPTPTTPSSPSFRSVFPGVLVYVPEEERVDGPAMSSTTSLPYYRDRLTPSPEPFAIPQGRAY